MSWEQGLRRSRKFIADMEMDGEILEPPRQRRRGAADGDQSGRKPVLDRVVPEPIDEDQAAVDLNLETLEQELEYIMDNMSDMSGNDAEDEAAAGSAGSDDGGGVGEVQFSPGEPDLDHDAEGGVLAAVGEGANGENLAGANADRAAPGEPAAADGGPDAGRDRPRPRGGEDELNDLRELLSSSTWGCFRITPKQPGTSGNLTFGGYEGSCKFHKKSDKTGCKKFVSIKGPGPEPRDLALRQVLYWCSQAKDHDRQRKHLAAATHPPPSMEVLNSWRIDEAPLACDVKSDLELDRLEQRRVAAGKAKATPKGRARGGKAAARGPGAKAKPAAKGSAARPGVDPGPDEAASDPTSTSSSSSSSSDSSSS